MSDTKNIVIIGASIAGQALANALVPNLPLTHRILLIDAQGYGSWPIASLRAAVAPGWESKVTAALSTATVFPSGSDHQVIAPNKVLHLKESSLVLERPLEGSTELPFFKCILATGSSQPFPMRPAPGSSAQEFKAALVKSQQDIAKATKIVIVGGGAVGLEMSGEIRSVHPKTPIAIVHSETHVLNPTTKPIEKTQGSVQSWTLPPTHPKLSTNLESLLKSIKVDTVLGDKVIIPKGSAGQGEWDGTFGLQNGLKTLKLESGKTLQADYVFLSVGNKVNSGLVAEVDSGALDGGMVAVDEYLKIRSTSPTSILKNNYFAIGDCASSPGWKAATNAQADADLTATNIINEVKGRPLKKLARGGVVPMVIPLGPANGAGTLTFPIIGTIHMPTFMVRAAKAKDLFVDQLFASRFKGAEKVVIA